MLSFTTKAGVILRKYQVEYHQRYLAPRIRLHALLDYIEATNKIVVLVEQIRNNTDMLHFRHSLAGSLEFPEPDGKSNPSLGLELLEFLGFGLTNIIWYRHGPALRHFRSILRVFNSLYEASERATDDPRFSFTGRNKAGNADQ